MSSSHDHPATPPPETTGFYAESLRLLVDSGIPFLVAGTFALCSHTGIRRQTKDIDLFCTPGDFTRILTLFQKHGFTTEIEDERWLGKVRKGELFFDVIFNASAPTMQVTDCWFEETFMAEIYGIEVRLVPPTELVWSKMFVQDRHKYDGADVAHLFLRQHRAIDWKRLLGYMDQYWEVLLAHIVNFRFIYPSERDCVPRWLLDELVGRLTQRADLPPPQIRICRGRLMSRFDYEIDTTEWGFAGLGSLGGGTHG